MHTAFLSRGFKNLQWYGMTLFETLELRFEGFSFPLLDPVFFSLSVSGGDKKNPEAVRLQDFGGDNRTRICDLSRVRRALYQLSYASMW